MEHVMAGPGFSLKMATANLLLLALFSFTPSLSRSTPRHGKY